MQGRAAKREVGPWWTPMIVRLFCAECVQEALERQLPCATIDVPVPVSRLADDGEYQVHCCAGHVTKVILDNLKFELLFEMGLNALVDGYPREAVSSFASSLERFQEFFWRVVMAHYSIPPEIVDAGWKPLSRLSERQLGAYVTAWLLLSRSQPALPNPNKEVVLRNNVIHNGYVPTNEEAISFGDTVMSLINRGLDTLRELTPDIMLATYARLSPRAIREAAEDKDHTPWSVVNIPTSVDVRYPPKGDDLRVGNVAAQLPRIIKERSSRQMDVFTIDEFRKRFPDRDLPGLPVR